jgi:integrase
MSDSEPKKPRYFVEKPQKGGSILYYWQPSKSLASAGYKTVPLSRNRTEAIQQAEALNAKVDQWRGGQPVLAKNQHGTLPWLIDVYKQSPKWQKLKPRTKDKYETCFRHILRWSAERGDPPMRTITKLDAEALWSSMQDRKPFMADAVNRIAGILWNYADGLEMDIVVRNPFRSLGLPELPSREQKWQGGQIAAVVETAIAMGRPSIALATIIAINTAQRPSDIRALKWSQYDGKLITLTQIKTGATVTIPVTAELKVALDDAKRGSNDGKVVPLSATTDGHIVINEETGRPWQPSSFVPWFRRIARAAGIPDSLQFRDLRRTATTQLAEAQCTLHEIAAIGGWTVDTVAKMMEVYGKVNVTMAENAIVKLEQYRAKRPLEA